MSNTWPCPCCGYLTLATGPGDYEVCPVCEWEDDETQLRWPLFADGANGISLVEAQRNYQRIGACSEESLEAVRPPGAGEPLADGWRPLDLEVDAIEQDPRSPSRRPWPANSSRLYWWKSDYYLRTSTRPAAQDHPPEKAWIDQFLERVPEAAAAHEQVQREYEAPAPMPFCTLLSGLVGSALETGNLDLAQRVVETLNAWLTLGDPFAYNCVTVGFLEDERWHDPAMDWFIAEWPAEIRSEITRQRRHT